MAKLDLASALKQAVAPAPVTLTPDAPAPAEETLDSIAKPAEEPAARAERRPAGPQKRRQPARSKTAPTSPAPVRAREDGEEIEEPSSKGVAIELPVELGKRLDAHRMRTRKSHHTILLDAIEHTYEQLPELIDAALGREAQESRANLFNRSKRASAPIAVNGPEEKVRHTVRMKESSRQTLDDLTDQFAAPSRNFLIVTAYDAYLPPLTD